MTMSNRPYYCIFCLRNKSSRAQGDMLIALPTQNPSSTGCQKHPQSKMEAKARISPQPKLQGLVLWYTPTSKAMLSTRSLIRAILVLTSLFSSCHYACKNYSVLFIATICGYYFCILSCLSVTKIFCLYFWNTGKCKDTLWYTDV